MTNDKANCFTPEIANLSHYIDSKKIGIGTLTEGLGSI